MEKSEKSVYWPVVPAALALAGVVLFIFVTYGPPASSSGYVAFLKGIFSTFAPEYAKNNPHYAPMGGAGSWLMTFVFGMAIGGFIGGRTSRNPVPDVPDIWVKRFGPSRTKRFVTTFLAGFVVLFASRLAGGCTLGLFISNNIQLGISGIYFSVMIFITAVITAHLVYGKVR